MSFVIRENEPFAAAVKRIAIEQIDLAVIHLADPSGDLNKSVHATRQSLKRIRALLALARGDLGDKVFQRESACFRRAGRMLSRGRDAAVIVETFDALFQRFQGELTADAFASEHTFLEERRDARIKVMVEEEGALKKASEMLTAARERVADWRLRHAGFEALKEGVRRSYRAGHAGLRRVMRDPSPANFHEWRRPVKLLWHQLQIVAPFWPVVLNAHGGELRELSDRLNENHDLHVFRRDALRPQFDGRSRDRQMLISLVGQRCRQLEAEAIPLGERLYTEPARRFVDRIEGYCKTWEHESRDRDSSQLTREDSRLQENVA